MKELLQVVEHLATINDRAKVGEYACQQYTTTECGNRACEECIYSTKHPEARMEFLGKLKILGLINE